MNKYLEERINALAKIKGISNEQLLERLITSEEEALAWLEQEKNNNWVENSSDRSSWLFDLTDKSMAIKTMDGKTNRSIDKRYK